MMMETIMYNNYDTNTDTETDAGDDDIAKDIDSFFADDADTTDGNDDNNTDVDDKSVDDKSVDDNSDNGTSDTDGNDNNDNDNNDNNDSDKNDGNDVDTNDDRDGVSDLSAAILGSKTETDEQFNTNSNSDSDMQYYVKITLINMWLILGLIVVVNICFYWCYCRNTKRSRTLKKGFANDSSDALGGVSEEENMA